MKTHIRMFGLMLAAAGVVLAGSLQAASREQKSVAYQVDGVVRDGQIVVKVGSADSTVRYFLGSPEKAIERNQWVYTGYRARSDNTDTLDCERLVITFVKGRVADIKLVNNRALELIAARAKARSLEEKSILMAREN